MNCGTIGSLHPCLRGYITSTLELFSISYDCIIKFPTYHQYYKDIICNLTRTFVCTTNCLFYIYSWSNLLIAIFTNNRDLFAIELGLVTKKKELLKTSLHLFFYQPLSLYLSLMFLKICLIIFKYSLMSKCLVISKYITVS